MALVRVPKRALLRPLMRMAWYSEPVGEKYVLIRSAAN